MDNGHQAVFKVDVISSKCQRLGYPAAKMEEELDRYDARVDAIYFCPHHPDEECECRKPKPALLLQAAKEIGINLKRSYMIGDNAKDIEAGKAAGCKAILVTTGPYRYVRHPMYTALVTVGISLTLLSANLYFGLPFIALIVVVAFRIRKEEEVMNETFGEEYIEYKKRTKRFIPYII